MEHFLDTDQYLDAVCRMLQGGAASVPVPVKGVSMRPFLRTGDFVFLQLPGEKIRKGDIVLFRRANGQYVLHRVMKIRGDRLWMQGDSQLVKEPIRREQVRARATGAKIRGEMVPEDSFHWWKYAHLWRWLSPIRRQISWMHQRLNGK